MFDLTTRYDVYASLLNKHIQTYACYFILIFMAIVGFVLLLVFNARLHAQTTDDKTSETSNEIGINVLIVLMAVAILGATIVCSLEIANCIFDKKNCSYIVVQSDFSIEKAQYSYGLWVDDDMYSLKYISDGKEYKTKINTTYCPLDPEDNYDNTILVFSSKSKIVLDIINIDS